MSPEHRDPYERLLALCLHLNAQLTGTLAMRMAYLRLGCDAYPEWRLPIAICLDIVESLVGPGTGERSDTPRS